MTSGITAQDLYQRIAVDLVEARVRVRALLELLEEKGIIATGDYDSKAEIMWERDFEALYLELSTPPEPEPEEQVALQAPPQPLDPAEYAVALMQNIMDEAVNTRIRMRAMIEVLEEKGVLAPGEYDQKADVVWDRDYEELSLEFYRRHTV